MCDFLVIQIATSSEITTTFEDEMIAVHNGNILKQIPGRFPITGDLAFYATVIGKPNMSGN